MEEKEKYVVVFGGCSWDSTFKQREDLSFPTEADISLPGGKGSNQAVAISRAGYKVKMISVLGDDDTGMKILENLMDNNIDISRVKILKNTKSDGARLFVSLEGDNSIKRIRQAIDKFNVKMIADNADILRGAEYVVTQSKIPRKVLESLINFCYKNKIKTVLTPAPASGLEVSNPKNRELLEKVTFITANEIETKVLMQNEDFEACIDSLPNLIATAGSKGVYFCDENGCFANVPAIIPKEVKDTTGAGDTFCGNFLVSLLNGSTKTQAVKIGVWAATLKLEKYGAQPGMPTKEELLARTKDLTI